MKDLAIVSIAFGDERYKQQLKKLEESIAIHEPDATFIYWVDRYPEGSASHEKSLYGFKVWGVYGAREQGFQKVIWLDPAVFLVDKMDAYFDIVKQYGVVAAKDDNLLCNYCGDKAFEYFGTTKENSEQRKEHLVGGSIYAFNFDLPLCNTIFEKWMRAEVDGMFGSQAEAVSGQIDRHRNDESCMALALYDSGSRPTPYDVCRYNNVPNPLVVKNHFK